VPTSHSYRGRRAASIANEFLRVTVLAEGGHIAEVFDLETGINPLWTPPWTSIEPSAFDPSVHGHAYGEGTDGRLLAGIMGHNLCLDLFGGPSCDEATAGLTAHGEGSVAIYDVTGDARALVMRTTLPLARIRFERRIELHARVVSVQERVESLCPFDRPIAWTEHVTLGPPFLEIGRTEFRLSAGRSRVHETRFGADDYLRCGACFDWPHAPRDDGGLADLRVFTREPKSSAYTTHLMDAEADRAFFVAYTPSARLAFGYVWNRSEFPWIGIWEENRSREAAPWNGATIARGMEFGVSPFPETRRAMVERGALFGTPTYRWLPAHGVLEAEYWIVVQAADAIPECLDWPSKGAGS